MNSRKEEKIVKRKYNVCQRSSVFITILFQDLFIYFLTLFIKIVLGLEINTNYKAKRKITQIEMSKSTKGRKKEKIIIKKTKLIFSTSLIYEGRMKCEEQTIRRVNEIQ